MKKALFVDRDGTVIVEPPTDFQVDSLEKLAFLPGAISGLSAIARALDYELVMVTNQDGLGTASFPEDSFWPAHNKMLETLKGEGVVFSDILIDRTFPHDNAPTRKPGTGLLGRYLGGGYDLAASFVIGDRLTDVQLAQNLGARAILFAGKGGEGHGADLTTTDWQDIFRFLQGASRSAKTHRQTKETDVLVRLDIDRPGLSAMDTGIGFFDHMLDQLARHGRFGLEVNTKGDLHIDAHHTIEDTALALGETFAAALGDKRGIQRYGFALLPMDDCLAQVALDLSGRPWLVWDARFEAEHIGGFPTEMLSHFFKSFSDAARCNLNIKAEGFNAHHKAEIIFKAFAKALRMAVDRIPGELSVPSTKGIL